MGGPWTRCGPPIARGGRKEGEGRAGGGASLARGVPRAAVITAPTSPTIPKPLRAAQTIQAAKRRRQIRHQVQLCEAASKGDTAAVEYLIGTQGVDVNVINYDSRTPLHLAAAFDHAQIVQMLVAARAELDVADRYGDTPLYLCYKYKAHAAGRTLLRAGANLCLQQEEEVLFSQVALPDGAAELELLFEYGCSPSVSNYSGRTVLHVAAAEGRTAVVRTLLQHKADVNAKDDYGRTPLRDAYMHNRGEVSEALIAVGANLGKMDVATAFCEAAAGGDVPKLKRLLHHRCNINAQDFAGRTALHLAAADGRLSALDLLTTSPGVDLNLLDSHGQSPLDYACRNSTPELKTAQTIIRELGGREGPRTVQALDVALTAKTREARAAEALQRIEAQVAVVADLRAFRGEMESKAAAMRSVREVCESAAAVRDQSAVLETVPTLFDDLKAYVEQHRHFQAFLKHTFFPKIDELRRNKESFAFLSDHDMEQLFEALQVRQPRDRPLLRACEAYPTPTQVRLLDETSDMRLAGILTTLELTRFRRMPSTNRQELWRPRTAPDDQSA